MARLMRFSNAVRRDSEIDAWLDSKQEPLRTIAKTWFERLRQCGDDVCELMHDGHPTACVGDAAFAYVNCFTHHVNVGFFRGAQLPDPRGLLAGDGKFMRHAKLYAGEEIAADALIDLIDAAYADMKKCVSDA